MPIAKCKKCGREYDEPDYLTYDHICEVCKGNKDLIGSEMVCARW
jgi:predicted Zn-ribbon and HTH transcriptional regulator